MGGGGGVRVCTYAHVCGYGLKVVVVCALLFGLSP